jgi:DNA mismatch endonuclease (patch repair protein)
MDIGRPASANASPLRKITVVTDVFSKLKRSEVMSRIRSRGNKDTELTLAKLFRRHKITGWRRNQKIFGKPDFVFRQVRLALFVDGCFWHSCPEHGTQPADNRSFWKKKFARNQARARLVNQTLRRAGWRVLRIWEHELARKNETRLVERLKFFLKKRRR